MGPSPALMLDLATPLGPCHIRVPIADVITAVNTEAGHLTVRAAVKESAAHSDTPFCVEVSCAAACTWAEAEAPVEEPPRQLPVVAQRPSLYKGPGLVIGSALFWVAVLLHVVGPFATSVLVAIDAAIVGAIAYRYMAIRKSITRASAGTTTVRRPSKAKKRHVATVHVKFVRAELIEEPPLGTDDQDEEPLVAAIPEESAVAPVERTASLQQAPTIRRMPSLIKQGSARVVDFGIVSLRRVVTITSAAVEITSIDALIANAAAGGDLEDEEAATLRVLAAKSPVATPNLFRRYVAACGGDRVQALQRLRITVVSNSRSSDFSLPFPWAFLATFWCL